jgi:hypothetical protein
MGLAQRLAGSVTVDRQLKSEWASDEVNELHGVDFIGGRAALTSRHSGGRVPVTGELCKRNNQEKSHKIS